MSNRDVIVTVSEEQLEVGVGVTQTVQVVNVSVDYATKGDKGDRGDDGIAGETFPDKTGNAGKVPAVNSAEDGFEYILPTGAGTVTSVGLSFTSGSGLTVSGSPVTAAGTLAVAVNGETLLGFIGAAAAIHSHAAGDVTSGTFDTARIPDLSGTYSVVGHNHSGVYDPAGTAASAVSSHESTHNHTNFATAYGWGNHATAGYATTGQLHDAVTVSDTTTIDLTLTGQQISGAVIVQMSVTSDASGLKLSGDAASPGNTKYYGTDGSGTKGFHTFPAGSSHDPVTLSSDINTNLLSLSTQELDLDTQSANTVFAGPATGSAVKPTFRALVSGDIPDLSGSYDVSGTAAGAVSSHESTHNHANFATAYGWGDHATAGYAASSHAHGNITAAGAVGSTSNLPLITGSSGVIQASSFGTSANTFCEGNDSRLSDARTPTSHTHGNLTNDGKVGITSGLPIKTGTDGVVEAGAFGTGAGQFSEGNHGHSKYDVAAIGFVIAEGSALTTGVKGDIEVPFACTITAARLFADQSGSVAVSVWKDSYANFPPTVGDLIDTFSITAATKSEETGLSLAVSAGDILRFNVDSASTITRVSISLTATRT